MAYVDISGSNNIWQYDNAATISNTYPKSADGANSVISGGIRTYTQAIRYKFILDVEKKVKQKSVVSYQKLTMTHNRNKKWQIQN